MARKPKPPLAYYKFRCRSCGLTFRAATRDGDPDPACPNLECGVVQTPIGLDVSEGRAPGIGGSALGKAMDMTANMVMSDYAMTDLASARHGESMAPKLPPNQQARADAMFDSSKRSQVFGSGGLMGGMINGMAASAISNAGLATRPGEIDGISAIHSQRYTPPVTLLREKK